MILSGKIGGARCLTPYLHCIGFRGGGLRQRSCLFVQGSDLFEIDMRVVGIGP
jgi:hypothetical protein